MAKVKLKSDFNNDNIYIECDYIPVFAMGLEIKLDPNKYKSIRLKKMKGDWPNKMAISWNKDDFDLISPEYIDHYHDDKKIILSFKANGFQTKIDDFEIQIKRTSAKETEQGIGTTNEQDTTVTIGEAKGTESPVNKKKKG